MTPEQTEAESHGHRLSPPRGEVYVHGRRQPHSATCECGATFTTGDSEEQLLALHDLHLAHVIAHPDPERSSEDMHEDLVQGFDALVSTGDWLIVWFDTEFEGWAASLHDTSGCPCHASEVIRCNNGCCDPHNLTRRQAEALIRLGIKVVEVAES